MKSIALLIPYFGQFPEWAPLYFETLRRNSTIDFIFYTDCEMDSYFAPNIKVKKISFNEYVQWVNAKLGLNFNPANPYKICDLRPWFGELHHKDFQGYDFYGWTDMDLLFGDIRSFYTNDILENYEVLSTHEIRISGHLALFKNNHFNRNKWKGIYEWANKISHSEFVGIDEHGITNAYTMTIIDKFNEKFSVNINNKLTQWLSLFKTRKLYLKEQYTTPFTTIPWIDGSINSQHPNTWYYKDGSITNSRDGARNFIYLHFMNFKNSRWRHDGSKAPWENSAKVCFAKKEDLKEGVVIDDNGILPL